MIKNNLFRKILIFGIMTLFVGVGITSNMAGNIGDSVEEGLVACWHFDEGNKDIAYDSSGNNSGFIYGATWTDGISGFALELDGINDYVSIPDSNSLDITGNITIEAWIYLYSMPWVAPLVSKGTNSNNYGYYLAVGQYYSNGCASFKLHSNNTKILWLDSSSPLAIEQWHYVVVVRADNATKIYIDGSINNADTYFDGSIRTNGLSLEFGTYNDYSEFFHGILDEISIYNRALNTSEIYNHYREILSVSTGGEEPASEPSSKDTPGFEIVILFMSMTILAGFRWKYRRY
jgi:hypothetical protein